jgi:hypothetical protein
MARDNDPFINRMDTGVNTLQYTRGARMLIDEITSLEEQEARPVSVCFASNIGVHYVQR